MRDTKSLLLLLVSLMLVLVSFGLLWTWGYRFSNKEEGISTRATPVVTMDSATIANNIRDSLQKVYTATLLELDAQLDSTLANTDSLKNELDYKLGEFYRLRNEINMILKNRGSVNNFNTASRKITELKNKVDDIREKNQEVENENAKLNTVLKQLDKSDSKPVNNNARPVPPPVTESRPQVEKPNPVYQVFTASDMRLSALVEGDGDDTETNNAERTDKFTGSFTVTNFNSQLTNVEMVVVVLQPNGRVLKTSGWESGTFNTPQGKKIYSYKFNFNYSRGESKRLQFSLKTGGLEKGDYTMEVYYNGQVIGKTVKTLY